MKKNRNIKILLAAVVFSIVYSIIFKWIQTGNPLSGQTLFYGIMVFLNIIIPLTIAHFILKRFLHISLTELRKKIIPSILIFAIGLLFIQLLIVSGGVYLYFVFEELDKSTFFSHLLSVEIPGVIKQYSIWILIGSAVFFYYVWQRSVANESKLRESNLKYRYITLKSQVNPHFLFNSLNTLSELVSSDPGEAEKYIQELAGIYRYVIENEEMKTVALDDEIKFTESFFNLYEEREKGKIILKIKVGDTSQLEIIPVSLQSLIENAIKHNTASRENPLTIEIERDNDYLVIRNNIQRKNIMDTMKIGLDNLNERVKLIMGKELIIKDDDHFYVVRLPVKYTADESADH